MKSAWSILLPTGEYLDIPAEFNFSFELNNQVFSSGDTTVLPGSYSFPVDIPLTPKMRAQLKHPDRIDNARKLQKIKGVWVCVDGNPLFYGDLVINKSSKIRAQIAITINPMEALKSLNLDELDLETVTVAPTSWEDHMKNTALNPEDYSHVFFQVWNDDFDFTWNIWRNDTEVFNNLDNSIITPYVKVKYLLAQMFASGTDGWQFVNNWQGSDVELGRLYVFNNVDSRIQTSASPSTLGLPDSFPLTKYLPKVKCTEFLKGITAQWCCGIFTNVFNRTITLAALSDVLSAAPKADWTRYAASEPVIEQPDNIPGYFNYDQVDTLPSDLKSIEDATHIRTNTEFLALGTPDPGYYYIESNSALVEATDLGTLRFAGRFHVGVRAGDGEDYQAGIEAIFDFFEMHRWRGDYTGFHEVEGSSPLEHEWITTDYPLALMLYRGIQPYFNWGNKSTVSGNTVWLDDALASPGDRVKISTNNVDGPDAKRSLNWFGPYGLYETAHKAWNSILSQGKHCTIQFILPLQVLREFSFQDKIRVGNMDYFIKRIRVQKLLSNANLVIEASLITVI